MDNVWMWIAWRLPRSLVLWCYIRVMAHATGNVYPDRHPDEVGYSDACKAWDAKAERGGHD